MPGHEQRIRALGQDWTGSWLGARAATSLASYTPKSVSQSWGLGVRVSSTHVSQWWLWSGIVEAGVTPPLCNKQWYWEALLRPAVGAGGGSYSVY